jgi:hypothetical protein
MLTRQGQLNFEKQKELFWDLTFEVSAGLWGAGS